MKASSSFCILGFAFFAVCASAQQTNAPATGPRPVPLALARVMEGSMLGILTDDQRQSLGKPAEENAEKVRQLQQKLRVARQEMFAVALREKFDEPAVRAKAQAVANIEADLTVLRLQVLSQVQPPLTGQQLERLRLLGLGAPGTGARPAELRPGRQRILHNIQRDENGLPAKP